jgi:hypothetical protein
MVINKMTSPFSKSYNIINIKFPELLAEVDNINMFNNLCHQIYRQGSTGLNLDIC